MDWLRSTEEGYDVSPQQKHLWNLHFKQKQSSPYHAVCQGLLRGKLTTGALEQALARIIQQYEILRTTFACLPHTNVLVQVIAEDLAPEYISHDIRQFTQAEQQHFIDTLFAEQVNAPFDLQKGPLLRLHVAALNDDTQLLCLAAPALTSDFISLQMIIRTLIELCASDAAAISLTEGTLQYADLAEWQNRLLSDETSLASQQYWKQLNLTPSRNNPCLNEQGTVTPGEFTPQVIVGELLQAELSELQALAGQQDVALAHILQCIWHILLWKLANHTEVLIAANCAGRTYPELSETPGLFARCLPVVFQFHEQLSFLETLAQYSQIQTKIAEIQEYFSYDELENAESAAGKVFLYGFDFVNLAGEYTQQALSFSFSHHYTCAERFPLKLVGTQYAARFSIEIYYDSLLFEQQTIQQVLRQFMVLLQNCVQRPASAIGKQDIIGFAERNLLLHTFNSTSLEYSRHSTLPKLFEAQAERHPQHIALVYDAQPEDAQELATPGLQQLTYAELNARSNRLAHYLSDAGVGPEVLVALCLDRSIEMLSGPLAVLKTGGAYVPLDPASPPRRMEYLLKDTGASILITDRPHPQYASCPHLHVIRLDEQTDWAQRSAENLALHPDPQNLAYVIYTSGSSGQPKGVMIEHRNLLNLRTALHETVYQDYAKKQLQISLNAPLVFDASLQQLVMLADGHTLHLLPQHIRIDGKLLARSLQKYPLDVLDCTPSQLKVLQKARLFDAHDAFQAPGLVLIAGEAIDKTLWTGLLQNQSTRFYNLYGPTECTVDATYHAINASPATHSQPTIGRPLPNYRIYILDKHDQLTPLGVAGEICIGGEGLARGYLRRPALTAERFLPDHLSQIPGARLYRTGDLARYLADGRLEFIGRSDHQVKLRGFRIEPGEIEAVLTRHPQIHDACVIVRTEEDGHKQLVAYLIAKQQATERLIPTVEQISDFLRGELPDYMQPAACVWLEKFPLTSNAKLDRAALPAPDQARPLLSTTFVAPRNDLEKQLVQLWSQVLAVDNVGIHDSFFALGGDSIRTIQLHSLAQERGLSFPLQYIFKYHTAAELSAALASKAEAPEPSLQMSAVPAFSLLQPEDRTRLPATIEDAYPLSRLQLGMVFHSEYDHTLYQDIHSFHLRIPYQPDYFATALKDLLARHPVLRTSFNLSTYTEPIQLVHTAPELPFTLSDWRAYSAPEQEQLLQDFFAQEKALRFDWQVAPLVRFHIHLRGADTLQFTLTEHHAILDGWSVATLLSELFGQYCALLRAQPFSCQAPAAAFSQFIAIERAIAASQEAHDFWQRMIIPEHGGEIGRSLSLQRRGESANNSHTPIISTYDMPLQMELSQKLHQLSSRLAAPLKSILLTAHLKMVSVLSGLSNAITGLVTNGRPEVAEGERTLGLFLNTVPFLQHLSAGSWEALIQQVFTAEGELFAYQRFPLAQMGGSWQRQALFETVFNFSHFHIYQKLQELHDTDIEILKMNSYEATNFALFSDFSVNPLTLQIHVSIKGRDLEQQQLAVIGGYYERILTAIANSPTAHHEQQQLLPDKVYQSLIRTWNQTQHPFSYAKLLPELFEAQVVRTPNARAVSYEETHLTYHELNSRANQFAHYLQRAGVGPGMLVGVGLERSTELLLVILAILKTGGAYIPLDPTYPGERLAFMLRDAQAAIYVTHTEAGAAFDLSGTRVIFLNWQTLNLASERHTNLQHHQQLASITPAYTIYTSGSTGQPKGITITHSALINCLTSMQAHLAVDASDNFLALTSISFDISALELLLPLLIGAHVEIVERAVALDGKLLGEKLASAGITVMQATPISWQLLLDAGWCGNSTLKMLCGGEALPSPLASALRTKGQRLWNLYGPTETTIWSTIYEIPDQATRVLIGRPLANTSLYILDQHLQPVPIGVEGELYIGGAGVAQHYLHRPELTAERFLPDPFSVDGGTRLYRTGDLASYQPDGQLEYKGRTDNQIKLHGFRIELSEIEAVLRQHPAVSQVVASLRNETNITRIVAYIVPTSPSPSVESLRTFLQERLPAYMLPSAFLLLDAMPLTPNNKIDRRALPEPDAQRPQLSTSYLMPTTGLESQVAAIWQRILHLERVGLEDNFFDLGGNSLLMVQLHAQLREAIQPVIKLTDLFQYPTVKAFAAYLNSREVQTNASAPVTHEQSETLRSERQARRDVRQQQRQAF